MSGIKFYQRKMRIFWTAIIAIIASLFSKYGTEYDKIENLIKKKSSVPIIGLLFVCVALLNLFLFTFRVEDGNYIRGFDLVFKYHRITPIVQSITYILTIFFLIFKKTDKFRYATLFTVINLLLWVAIGFVEVPEGNVKLPEGKDPDPNMLLFGSGLLIALINILIFGLQSETETKNRFFKFTHRINTRIQAYHDRNRAKEMDAESKK